VSFCLVTFPFSNSSRYGQVRKKLVLLGWSHLLLQADHTSADVSGSSWLLTLVWELHARNLLSKAVYTFPEILKKKYSSPLFQSISQDSSKVEISLHRPTQPHANPTVDFAAELAVCFLHCRISPGHTSQAAQGTRAL